MNGVNLIWQELKNLMTVRNPGMTTEELQTNFNIISANAKFLTGLVVQAQKFTLSVEGQAIGFEMFYDPAVRCWKGNLRDALGEIILADTTFLAGVNMVHGLELRYRATNDEGNIVESDLAITGLFVTEPRGQQFDKHEQGIESSKYAFTKDDLGNSSCAILYFSNSVASDLYAKLINGEEKRALIDLDDLDYEIEVNRWVG